MNSALYPVLLVDDEPYILKASKLTLQSKGITEVITLDDSREVMPLLARQEVALIVLDLFMPHITGLDLLPQIAQCYPHIPVVVMTAVDETETAVECMKSGAFDYVVKPVESNRLLASIRKGLELSEMSRELSSLKEYLLNDRLEHAEAFGAIVTRSKKMRGIFQYAEVISRSQQPVLITGETGVGKELIAQAIHTLSGVAGEFVAVNVAGLDDAMFSDTLFGHKKGAFTGADQQRDGLVARAARGTLFLDEIGDLSELSQTKLLRLLQEREYYQAGSDVARKSDARILVATNHDLKKLLSEGRFRNDLFYRLCAHRIEIPPLRERVEDIPVLLDHFLGKVARGLDKKKPSPPPELAILLSTYGFPGNVRELEAMVYDAVARHFAGTLSMDSFKQVIGDMREMAPVTVMANGGGEDLLSRVFGHFPTMREMEDYLIAESLKMAKGNQGIAASLLGITRQTLNKRAPGKPKV